ASRCGWRRPARATSPCVTATTGSSLGLRPPASGKAAWPTSPSSAKNQRCARSRTSASVTSAGAHDQCAVSSAPCAPSSVSALTSRQCASGMAASPPSPSRTASAARPQPPPPPPRPPAPPRRPAKPPEIFEAALRRRKAGKLQPRPRVQIAQQSIAKPVARHRAQLLLDQLERTPKPRPPRQCLLNINPTHIQPHRVEAGEPANRARQIHNRPHLLAPVT